MIDRRNFLKTGAMASGYGLLALNRGSAQVSQSKVMNVRSHVPDSLKTRLAVRELVSGLRLLDRSLEIKQSSDYVHGATVLTLTIDSSHFKGTEQFEIVSSEEGVALRAASEQALLYAVFDFLERQGIVFGIDGTAAPIDPPTGLVLPTQGRPWASSPSFAVRGLLPWPDFLNCISVYNDEDFKAYFAAMMRMRFNMFGMHVYTGDAPSPLPESYLSFDFAGGGHLATLEDTTMTSSGYLPQRTSTYKMGASQFFDSETFGADAQRLAADNWDIAARTTSMLQKAFVFAQQLGIRTGIGFEPYRNPPETIRALPPEALSAPGGFVESNTARDLLERRLADLLERYPTVNYVWLWQDEDSNWQSRDKNVPLSVTPFTQAHSFLKRHAPEKQLVLAGWGGIARHFESLHQRLPEDVIFSALNDTVGWDPIHEAFGKLGSRERWPVPWIEDDPSMWFPQFRASRFETDMKRSEDLGCQGTLAIHWRHRIADPTATYFARRCWNRVLTASDHYINFCSTQASGARASQLATLFKECDIDRAIATAFRGTYSDAGFAQTIELAGDFDEGFDYAGSLPSTAELATQRKTADRFRTLAAQAKSPLERSRISYFAGFVGFMVPYCDALENAHKLDAVLRKATALRSAGKVDEAHQQIVEQAIPLWMTIAPLARQTMVQYQAIIATRNDLGQLASMQNKFVRITLERLRLSIKEFLGTLTPEMNDAYAAAISGDGANPARLFIPTRPSLIAPDDTLRIFVHCPGQRQAIPVKLFTRRQGTQKWNQSQAAHVGRNVYAAKLGPFSSSDVTIEYYATATDGQHEFTDPPQGPTNVYTVNILS
jgi:hypothetical protein